MEDPPPQEQWWHLRTGQLLPECPAAFSLVPVEERVLPEGRKLIFITDMHYSIYTSCFMDELTGSERLSYLVKFTRQGHGVRLGVICCLTLTQVMLRFTHFCETFKIPRENNLSCKSTTWGLKRGIGEPQGNSMGPPCRGQARKQGFAPM